MAGQSMEGSGILNISDYCEKISKHEEITDITPFHVAHNLQEYAQQSLTLVDGMNSSDNSELKRIVNDITTFAHLGNYYAEKIRGATELALFELTSDKSNQKKAIKHLEKAFVHWKNYANCLDAQYTPKILARTGLFDWNKQIKDVERDIDMAKNFELTIIDIAFEHVKDGAMYPVGTDLNVNLDIKSVHGISKVRLVLSGEYLGIKTTGPFLWDAENHASFKCMNTGTYELKAHVTDNEGTRVDKIITITIK